MDLWWLDESRFVGEQHLDVEYVAGYDAKAAFDPAPDVEVLKGHGLGASSTLIDLGAGTGTFAAAAAATGATVVAVDPSPAMADAIRRKTVGAPNVTVRQAGMLSYRHDGRADFVYSRNTLHQLPDFWKVMALARIGDMLVDGGLLFLRDLVYDTEPHDVKAAFDEWMASASPDSAIGYTRTELARHVATEFSTFSWLLEEALRRTGFEVVDKEVRRRVYAAYVCRFNR